MGVYLELFHGRADPEAKMEDWGEDGPIFGPYAHAHTSYLCDICMGQADGRTDRFIISNKHNLVYYDGMWYGDWSVFGEDIFEGVKGRIGHRLIPYDADRAWFTME